MGHEGLMIRHVHALEEKGQEKKKIIVRIISKAVSDVSIS